MHFEAHIFSINCCLLFIWYFPICEAEAENGQTYYTESMWLSLAWQAGKHSDIANKSKRSSPEQKQVFPWSKCTPQDVHQASWPLSFLRSLLRAVNCVCSRLCSILCVRHTVVVTMVYLCVWTCIVGRSPCWNNLAEPSVWLVEYAVWLADRSHEAPI